MVICLRRQLLFGVFLDLLDDGVGGREFDVLDEDRFGLVEVGFPLEDGFRVDGDGSPAVFGHGVTGGGGGGWAHGEGWRGWFWLVMKAVFNCYLIAFRGYCLWVGTEI